MLRIKKVLKFGEPRIWLFAGGASNTANRKAIVSIASRTRIITITIGESPVAFILLKSA